MGAEKNGRTAFGLSAILHTNYYLSSILTDSGYGLEKCGVVGEWNLTVDAGELCVKGKTSDTGMEDILRFSMANGIVRILAYIPGREGLPEQYGRLGFCRAYLYRCYQKKQEEKSSKERGGLKDGFTE